MRDAHVLIIGCGYLGLRVAALLRAAGARVAATTTRPERLAELRGAGLEPHLLDLAAPEASDVWTLRPDLVLCAVAPGGSGDPRTAFQSGPLDAVQRLHASTGEKLQRFVFISSTGVYHQTDGSWVDESSPAEPTEERHRLLRRTEDELIALARRGEAPAVVLRLGGLYGPGRSPVEWLRRPAMRDRLLQGGREAFMNWVRIEDAARAAELALERGRAGELYLVTDGMPVRRGDFYAAAAARAGIAIAELPSRPEDQGKRCSIQKARQELGYAPGYPGFREGLADL